MPIIINLDVGVAKRRMSLSELAEKVDITLSNLSILKTGKTTAVRFSTTTATGEVATLAGSSATSNISVDGAGSSARFAFPTGIAIDSNGNLYVTDAISNKIRKITVQ